MFLIELDPTKTDFTVITPKPWFDFKSKIKYGTWT